MAHSKHLGVFQLLMITIAAIISLRNLPMAAEFGLSAIFYFVVAALVFFIPIALVTAELATGWPQAGGNYIWVSEAFGKPCGFFALWASWMESIAWFPTILAFSAMMLAYLLEPWIPGLENSKIFNVAVILVIFWSTTFLNFLGVQTASWITALGVVAGTLIPGALIILMGCWWVYSGQPTQIAFEWQALIPEFHLESMVFFSGVLLGLAGVEIAVFHILEAKNPKRDYPRALVIASIMILLISILGTLGIAIVVPQEKISLLSGPIQAIQVFLSAVHCEWAVPFVALLALMGALAGINAWTAGPAKGLLVTAQDGFLPSFLKRCNHLGVPVGLLIFQALVGSALCTIFLWIENRNIAYWILIALSSQFMVVQYALVFAAAIKLRWTQPKILRAYTVPGGKIGLVLVSVIGMLSCIFGYCIVFIPPSQLAAGDAQPYSLPFILGLSFVTLAMIPVIFSIRRRSISCL